MNRGVKDTVITPNSRASSIVQASRKACLICNRILARVCACVRPICLSGLYAGRQSRRCDSRGGIPTRTRRQPWRWELSLPRIWALRKCSGDENQATWPINMNHSARDHRGTQRLLPAPLLCPGGLCSLIDARHLWRAEQAACHLQPDPRVLVERAFVRIPPISASSASFIVENGVKSSYCLAIEGVWRCAQTRLSPNISCHCAEYICVIPGSHGRTDRGTTKSFPGVHNLWSTVDPFASMLCEVSSA